MSRPEYVLANASSHSKDGFSGLEALCDPVTFRHLESVGIAEGWSCLEIGAGGGSVARWMGERVVGSRAHLQEHPGRLRRHPPKQGDGR